MKQRLINWWQQHSHREQILLASMVIFVISLLFYLAFWQPLAEQVDNLRTNVRDTQQLLSWMQDAENTLTQLRSQRLMNAVADNQPLVLKLEQSMQNYSQLNRQAKLQQLSQTRVLITFDQISFDTLITWLREIQLHKLCRLDSFNSQALEHGGLVKAEVTLSQAGE